MDESPRQPAADRRHPAADHRQPAEDPRQPAADRRPQGLRHAQERVDRWIGRFEEGYWPPLAILARLMEEVGELSREINHLYGSKPKRADEAPAELELEIADILFVLISLANQQGIDLEDAFDRAMAKYEARDGERWTPRAPERL